MWRPKVAAAPSSSSSPTPNPIPTSIPPSSFSSFSSSSSVSLADNIDAQSDEREALNAIFDEENFDYQSSIPLSPSMMQVLNRYYNNNHHHNNNNNSNNHTLPSFSHLPCVIIRLSSYISIRSYCSPYYPSHSPPLIQVLCTNSEGYRWTFHSKNNNTNNNDNNSNSNNNNDNNDSCNIDTNNEWLDEIESLWLKNGKSVCLYDIIEWFKSSPYFNEAEKQSLPSIIAEKENDQKDLSEENDEKLSNNTLETTEIDESLLDSQSVVPSSSSSGHRTNADGKPNSYSLLISPPLSHPIPSIISGPPLTDRLSTFQAHIAKVSCIDDVRAVRMKLMENSKIRRATHNMIAYRINQGDAVLWDDDEDGEDGAGVVLSELVRHLGVCNSMVVVSRWFGGILLGGDRFKDIKYVAQMLLEENGWTNRKKGPTSNSGKKK